MRQKRISEETAFSFRKQWIQKEKAHHPSGWLDSVNQRAKFLLLSVREAHLSQWSQLPKDHLSSFSLSLCLCLSVSANQLIKSNGIDKNGSTLNSNFRISTWFGVHSISLANPLTGDAEQMDSTPINPLNVRVDQLGQLFSSVYFGFLWPFF